MTAPNDDLLNAITDARTCIEMLRDGDSRFLDDELIYQIHETLTRARDLRLSEVGGAVEVYSTGRSQLAPFSYDRIVDWLVGRR